MNKSELVDVVAGKVGDRRTALVAVETVLDAVARTVAGGERVALSGFGVFEKADRAARTARNPATGATVEVTATSVPRFRPGQVFKAVVSGARPLPDEPAALPADARTRAPRTAPAAPPVAADTTPTASVVTVDEALEAADQRADDRPAGRKKADTSKAGAKKSDTQKSGAKKSDAKAGGKKSAGKEPEAKKGAKSGGKKSGKK